jgi:hypothetical protein
MEKLTSKAGQKFHDAARGHHMFLETRTRKRSDNGRAIAYSIRKAMGDCAVRRETGRLLALLFSLAMATPALPQQGSDTFVLRVEDNSTYRLDDLARAKPFQGSRVKVVGHLAADRKTLLIEDITRAPRS